ncbi:response regulator [Ferrimonas pelagia]|uniref:histidine kinase n=1 Tax=Ferrimonas pelagia TaxID=1177826 RepID=A0ABP9ESQ6_9GAMM
MSINWQRRCERERSARLAAEALLEERSEQLYEANLELQRLNQEQSHQLADQGSELARRRNYEGMLNRIYTLLLEKSFTATRQAISSVIESIEQIQPGWRVLICWRGQWSGNSALAVTPTWRQVELTRLDSQQPELVAHGARSGLWCAALEQKLAILVTSEQRVPWDEVEYWFFRTLMASLKSYFVNVQAYHKMAEAERETHRLAQMRYRFLASVTHELRTPLNGMLAGAELLAESALSPEQMELLDIVSDSGNSLLALINDVLDYAKIEDGEFAMSPVPTLVQPLLDEIYNIVLPAAQERGNALEFTWQSEPVDCLRLDPLRTKQILLNLLSNAIKFTQEGAVSLTMEWEPRLSQLKLVVSDQGVGMTRELVKRIFEPFAQASGAEHRGTGLGLAICNHLCAAMDADIEVLSEPGLGTEFHLAIPTERAHLPKISLPAEQRRGHGAHLLLVEDTRANQVVAKLVLEKAGFTVELAGNGAEAVRCVEEQAFSLILMDCRMPVMDGFECTEQLRQMGYSGPILALTATTTEEDLRHCRDVGMDDVLVKPFQKRALLAKIDQWLVDPG